MGINCGNIYVVFSKLYSLKSILDVSPQYKGDFLRKITNALSF